MAQAQAISDDPGGLLLVDGVERYPKIEEWLAEGILPQLPVGALAVIVARLPPASAWHLDLGWSRALVVRRLGPLLPGEAARYLQSAGVPTAWHEDVLGFARGYPLALGLAAAAVREGQHSRGRQLTPPLARQLLDRIVGELPSPAHRQALEVCAHAWTTDESLLRAVLPEDASSAFDWLRRLPYVESGANGVHPWELIREVIDSDHRWRDRTGYETTHGKIRRHLVEQARSATTTAVIPATLALTYLHRHNGFVSRFITWKSPDGVHEDTYRPSDRGAVLSLIEVAEGAESAHIAAFWLDRQPAAFRVYRRDGEAVAVAAWLRLSLPLDEEVARDPVTAACWRHARSRRPLRSGEHLAIARYMVAPDAYQRPSPVMDLMIHRILAEFIHGEKLAWSFVVMAESPFWQRLMTYIDQRPLVQPVSVGEHHYTVYAHDWRTVSVQRWLEVSGLVELEGPVAQPAAAAESAPGPLAVLTREQFGLAVREALNAWHRRGHLADNPLTRSRLVSGRPENDPVAAVREVITDAVDALGADPDAAAWHRAVAATFMRGATTREARARRLGVSLSTYRRHLARGMERLIEDLWNQELRGADTPQR
ncbi:ATP-binding protein [Streptomyces melanosporofaciens]|uniref:ATP-binding protein n=1 Tax=Streptomyces melanosporofaciens TaxID=67327 RepID=UPI001FCAD2CC|nr:ATP-binding protein [Streptomyces melanosporofaciens]